MCKHHAFNKLTYFNNFCHSWLEFLLFCFIFDDVTKYSYFTDVQSLFQMAYYLFSVHNTCY